MKAAMNKQRGVSLVEVLVAVLVLSVGVIGMAGLQVQALQASTDSSQRTTALILARSIVGQMRSNVGAMSDYAAAYQNIDCDAGAPQSCSGAKCSTGQMAAYDAYSLMCGNGGAAKSAMAEHLASPTVDIVCSPAACDFLESEMTVTVEWVVRRNNSDAAGADLTQQVVLSTRL